MTSKYSGVKIVSSSVSSEIPMEIMLPNWSSVSIKRVYESLFGGM